MSDELSAGGAAGSVVSTEGVEGTVSLLDGGCVEGGAGSEGASVTAGAAGAFVVFFLASSSALCDSAIDCAIDSDTLFDSAIDS